jgi:hypothetical protein
MLVPERPYQPNLMFVGKAGAYHDRLERPARDKHSSLFDVFISYVEKSFKR